jgi:thiol:disulfide interchange protein DsbA
MKKYWLIALSVLLIPLQACSQELYSEGKHYEVISETATAEPEVLEFFSFWCNHCYNFEPLVASMKGKLKDKANFTKVHVNFMGFASKDLQDTLSRAMLMGKVMKKEAEVNGAIFNYLHKTRARITNVNDVRNIFISVGIEGAEFDKLAKSFGVNSLLMRNNKTIKTYRSAMDSVPTFIVNGKYKATFTRDMTPDQMIDLVVWLTALK